jgi:hypothetical protein
LPADAEVFVRVLDNSESSLEFGPPLVAPLSPSANPDVADAPAAQEHKLPTNEVWDDTGWRSEQ